MKIEDLPEDQLADLMRRYYDGEKVGELIEAFGLDVKPSQLVSTFPPERLPEPCRQCGGTMIRPRVGRSSYSAESLSRCELCGHFDAPGHSWRRCSCEACADEEIKATQAREFEIVDVIDAYVRKCELAPVSLADLTIRQRIYLAALATAYADEDLRVLLHVGVEQTKMPPVAPRSADVISMIRELWSAGAIGLMRNSPRSAFDIEQKPGHPPEVVGVIPSEVIWEIQIVDVDRSAILIPNCTPTIDEALILWHEMSQSEALAYLESERDRYGIDAVAGDKTSAIIREIVEKYSTAETQCLVWMAMRDLFAAMQERYMNRRHVGNSLPVFIKNKFEHYQAKKYDPKQFDRRGKQSIVSQLLYNHVLGIGENGFTLRPTTENLNPPAACA